MSGVFVSRPGKMAVIRSTGPDLPGTLKIKTANGAVFSDRVIVTGLDYDQAGHAQFQQTLLNAIYMWSFGDRMGTVALQGVGFSDGCPDGGSTESGVENVLAYYAKARFGNEYPVVTVMIGRKPVNGYLMGCRIRTLSVEHLTYSFMLQLATVPPYLDNAG